MPWMRLDAERVIGYLRASYDPADPDGKHLAEQLLGKVREELLSGRCVAVQHHLGEVFIGTEDEAVERMMEHAGA